LATWKTQVAFFVSSSWEFLSAKGTDMRSNLLSKLFVASLFVVTALFAAVLPAEAAPRIEAPSTAPNVVPAFDTFVKSVTDGSNGVRGVYVPGLFALSVRQQPAGNAGYVSTAANTVTQFGMAANYGVTGLLAHNYLAGRSFSALVAGQVVSVVYGDGSVKKYAVSGIYQFQALDPTNPSSDFVNLNTGARLTASNLFGQMYGGAGHLTFQTCIARDGNSSWGRLFIIATPIN
jgi:hypothetical protein